MKNRKVKYNGDVYVVGKSNKYLGHPCNKPCMLGDSCKFKTKDECPLRPYEVFLYRYTGGSLNKNSRKTEYKVGDEVYVISSEEHKVKCEFCDGGKEKFFVKNSKNKKISMPCPECLDKGYVIGDPNKFYLKGKFVIRQITVTIDNWHDSTEVDKSVQFICENVDRELNSLDDRAYTIEGNCFKDKKSALAECKKRNREE